MSNLQIKLKDCKKGIYGSSLMITLCFEGLLGKAGKVKIRASKTGRLLNVLCAFNLRPVSTGYVLKFTRQ